MAAAVMYTAPDGRERAVMVEELPEGRRAGADPGHFMRQVEGWRTERRQTVRGFAEYLGVSPSYYSLVRRGLRPVTMALVMRVLRERPELAYWLPADAAEPSC